MTIKIEQADNGFIVRETILDRIDENGNEIFITETEVIEEEGEQEGLKKLLYTIAEKVGYHHDKWSEENLNINFDLKGRKAD